MVVSFSLLIHDDYIFRDRGQLDVKGKGLLSTYFLLGQNGNLMTEPEDHYCNLPLISQDGVQMQVTEIKGEKKQKTISETCNVL